MVQTAPYNTNPANQQQGTFVLVHITGGRGGAGEMGEGGSGKWECELESESENHRSGFHALSRRRYGQETAQEEKV